MRVHALFGGPKRLKIALIICWAMYAVPTATLLGYALHQRECEHSTLRERDLGRWRGGIPQMRWR